MTLEFVLAMPLLVLSLAGAVQFSATLVVNNTLQAAASEAARQAAMGTAAATLVEEVDEFLALHDLAIGPGVRLVIQNANGMVASFGDASLASSLLLSSPAPGHVQATVIVMARITPVPNALANYCFDIENRQFAKAAVAVVP